MNTDWAGRAACRDDPEAMYGDSPAAVAAAKRTCGGCPVRNLCLEAALDRREPWGIWGGHAVAERERLRAGRTPATCASCRLPYVPAVAERRCAACTPAPANLPPGAGTLTAHRETVTACTADGWTAPDIARLLGCTPDSVRKAQRRWGLQAVDAPTSVRELAPCGTPGALRRHQRRGEPVDDVCRQADRDARAQAWPRRAGRHNQLRAARRQRERRAA